VKVKLLCVLKVFVSFYFLIFNCINFFMNLSFIVIFPYCSNFLNETFKYN
jgi:hypothetical protein